MWVWVCIGGGEEGDVGVGVGVRVGVRTHMSAYVHVCFTHQPKFSRTALTITMYIHSRQTLHCVFAYG